MLPCTIDIWVILFPQLIQNGLTISLDYGFSVGVIILHRLILTSIDWICAFDSSIVGAYVCKHLFVIHFLISLIFVSFCSKIIFRTTLFLFYMYTSLFRLVVWKNERNGAMKLRHNFLNYLD